VGGQADGTTGTETGPAGPISTSGADDGQTPMADDGSGATADGTTSGGSTTDQPGSTGDETGAVDSVELALTRKYAWPGGGREFLVKVVDANGDGIAADVSADLAVDLDDSTSEIERAPLPPGYTAVLISLPASAAETLALVDSLSEFVNARPEAESIGLFVWRDSVEQLAGFGQPRERLLAQISELPDYQKASSKLSVQEALEAIEYEAVDIGGRAPTAMRAAVVAGANPEVGTDTEIPVIVGLDGASEQIDTLAAEAFYKVALCGDTQAIDAVLSGPGDTESIELSAPATLSEEVNAKCDLAAISAGDRTYPEKIEFVFSPEQQAIYDQYFATSNESDFALNLRVGDGGLATGTAHLRGFSTLNCARKSYTLQLDGAGRHFMPESRSDEFYLISMCQDNRYVQMYTSYTLLQERGMFAPKFRYVELVVSGESLGIYLMMEKMREELVRDHSRVQGVLRRRYGYFEVEYANPDDSFLSLYEDTSENLATAGQHIDLPQYYRFLGTMSAIQNGDYIDELFITGVEQSTRNGLGSTWFTVTAWDQDDIQSNCHNGGANAWPDPYQLAYCAESDLAEMLLSDPTSYGLFVDALENVLLEDITPDVFNAALAKTSAAIMPYLAQSQITEAMVVLLASNPGAANPAVAQQDVQDTLDEMGEDYADRHSLLLNRIAIYDAD